MAAVVTMVMRTASCLTLLAIGAILTFAVTTSPSFFNIQIAGVVIMATGAAGLFMRKPTQGWLRRRTVLRDARRGRVVGHVDETRYPPYVMLNPGAEPEESNGRQPGDLTAAEAAEPGGDTVTDLPSDEAHLTADKAPEVKPGPAEEVVEEYIEE
jgi:hypothetical protein